MQTGVYVHFPWCARKCPYCDFATEPREAPAIPHAAYADAILRELDHRRPQLEGAALRSVFFGGGTPSLWEPAQLGRVLRAVREAFGSAAADVEVTVECNPSSLDAAHAEALRREGVDRLSLGVQSLDDASLRFLGRLHDSQGALRAVRAATGVFDRVSADLMFGMPGQSVTQLTSEVQRLVGLGLDHVSAYALTVEPATPFGERARRGELPLCPDDAYAAMFLAAREAFADLGLDHYEVSNYARPEQESRHNQHYWQGGSYLGLGAAAVGAFTEGPAPRRYRNHPKPERYMERAGGAECEVFEEALDAETLVREALMLGLRTREGVDVASLGARLGLDPLAPRRRAVEARTARGDVVLDGDHLRVPPDRWLHLDSIVAALF